VTPELARSSRYHIEARLGAGGMGVVYRALDRERGVRVALKMLLDLHGQALYRFKKEFRALADLHHPNLCSLGELVSEGGLWFFTMELVEGTDFLSWVRPDPEETLAPGAPAFDERRLRAALLDLASAIAFLHENGKVHRDVKPSNVLVTPQGRVVVLDFGLIAEEAPGERTEATGACGTPAYMAPEQVTSMRVGPPADGYAVGAILYRALTGVLPIQGATSHEVMQRKRATEPAPPQTLVPAAPADLCALCCDLLRIDPEARPRAGEVLARLRGAGAAAVAAAALPAEGTAAKGPAFVGRERELAALEEALGRSHGGAVAVCIGGESGIGKTALVRRFLDRLVARDGRALALAGRCYERESVPFKGFDGIVDALSHGLKRLGEVETARRLPRERDAAMLVRLFPVLGRVPAFPTGPPVPAADPAEVRTGAFRGLRELLSRLAERGPLVLFIDDLQWTDRDSLVLLDEVLAPPEAPALLLIATLRGIAPPALPCRTDSLDLEPLSGDESRELLRLLLPEGGPGAESAPAAARAEAVAAEAKGHPLFLQELARSAGAPGGTSAPGGAAPRLDEVLRSRISDLEPAARRLIQVVAAAGAPIDERTAVEAAGLAADEGSRRFAELRGARLVRPLRAHGHGAVETYHDRVREAIVAGLDEAARRSLYLRLADALERSGAADSEPIALVENLEAAGEAERAARYAARAAARAAGGLAFDRAAELYRKALALGRHGPERVRELTAALGEALANAGRGREAAAALLSAAEGASREERLRCRIQAARQLLGSGHVEEGLAVVRGVLAEVGGRWPRTQLGTVLSLVWHRAVLRLRGFGFRAREEPELAPLAILRADAFHAVASCMAGIDPFRAAAVEARALRLALALGDRQRVIRALIAHVNYGAAEGARSDERMRRRVDQVREVAEADGRLEALVHLDICRGLTSLFTGRFREADRWLLDVDARIGLVPGLVPERSTARIARLSALFNLGRFAELCALQHEYIRDALHRGDRYVESTLSRFYIVVWLAEDGPAGARAQLARLTWAPPEVGYHMQHWYDLASRHEIDLYEGKVADGRTVAGFEEFDRSLLKRFQLLSAYAAWLRGRLALGAAAPALDVAAGQAGRLHRMGPAYARVWGLLLDAGAAAVRSDRAAAESRLRQVIAVADPQSLALCAAVARHSLGALVGGAEGDELIAAAAAYFRVEGVRRPDRLVAMYAPGFGRS